MRDAASCDLGRIAEIDEIYRELTDRAEARQRMLRGVALLCCAAGMLTSGARLTAAPPELYKEVDGLSFSVFYPPGDMQISRAYPSAEPGALMLLYSNPTPAHAAFVLERLVPTGSELEAQERFQWLEPLGEIPSLVWPDGRVLSAGMPDELANGMYRHYFSLRRCPPLSLDYPVQSGGPEHEFSLTISKLRSPRILYSDGSSYAAVYSERGGTNGPWFIAGSDSQHGQLPERDLGKFEMRGAVWLNGTLTTALLTLDPPAIQAYDLESASFVELPEHARLAQRLANHNHHGYFWVADGFAVCRAPSGSFRAVSTEGRIHMIERVDPIAESVEGKPHTVTYQAWLDVKDRLLARPSTLVGGIPGSLSKSWAVQGRHVAADHGSSSKLSAVLLDEDTVALVDQQFRRITLVRRSD